MLNALGLGFLFTAKDEASSVMEKIKGNLERLKESGEEAHAGLAASAARVSGIVAGSIAAVGAAGTVAAFGLASAAGKFETSITSAGAIAGASTAEFQKLREAALQAGLAAQFTPVEATKALQDLAAAGYNVKDSIGLLTPVLDLAGGSLGQLSPSDAAGLASQTMKAFGLSVGEAGISVDKLLQSVNMFSLEARDLPLSLGIASRGAQVMSQSLDETLIALGLVKNIIPSISDSATGVSVAMERLVDPEWQEKIRGLGVTVTDSNGRFRSFLDILNELQPQLAKMSNAESSAWLLKTFGHHALGSISAIMTQLRNGIPKANGEIVKGGDAVKYLREQFEGAGGTAAKFRDLMANTFDGQKQMLGSAISTAAIMLGEPFKDMFTGVMKDANLFIRGLIQLFSTGEFSGDVKKQLDKKEGVKGAVIDIFVWIERIKNFLDGFSKSFGKAFDTISPKLTSVAGGLGGIGKAFGVTGQTAEENAEAFDKFGEAGESLGETLGAGLDAALAAISFGLSLVIELVGYMKGLWSDPTSNIKAFFQVVKGVVGMIGALFTGDWRQFWNGFVDVVVGAAKIVVNIVFGILQGLGHALDKLNGALGIRSTFESTFSSGQKFLMERVEHGGGIDVLKYDMTKHPGVAAAAAAASPPPAPMSRADGKEEKDTHLRVDLHLDGERLASQLATVRRSSDVRSYHSAQPEAAY